MMAASASLIAPIAEGWVMFCLMRLRGIPILAGPGHVFVGPRNRVRRAWMA